MIYKENDDAIKSVKSRVIHGLGVRFGSPETKDYDGEWFSENSEVGLIDGANRPFLIEHGWSRQFGKAKVADATFHKSGDGWAYEAIFLDTELGNRAFNEVVSKPYKSSAGAAGHTRVASLVKGTYHLDNWLIAEQSATLIPNDSENPRITRVKSSEDYLLRMVEEMRGESDEKIQGIMDAFEKSINESRVTLANALTALKDSFVNEQKRFEVTDEFLAELERVVQPIEIRS